MGSRDIAAHLEDAFLRSLAVAEASSLLHLRQLIAGAFAKGQNEGLSATHKDGDDDEFLPFLVDAEKYVGMLEDLFGSSQASAPSSELLDVLRRCLYAITDKDCFDKPPAREEDVHRRVEAVLRCVYPDLMHKPPLAKIIKGFVPDTGIPSLKTLIEYKFVATAERVSSVTDEILADSRGYVADQWLRFVYVIYETSVTVRPTPWRRRSVGALSRPRPTRRAATRRSRSPGDPARE